MPTKSEQSELAIFFQQNGLAPYFFKFLKENLGLWEIQYEKDLSDFSNYFVDNLCDYLSFVTAVNQKNEKEANENLPNNQEGANEAPQERENLADNQERETSQRSNIDNVFEDQTRTETRRRKPGMIPMYGWRTKTRRFQE